MVTNRSICTLRHSAQIGKWLLPYISDTDEVLYTSGNWNPYEFAVHYETYLHKWDNTTFPLWRDVEGKLISTMPYEFLMSMYIANIWGMAFTKDTDCTNFRLAKLSANGYSFKFDRTEGVA